MVFIFQMIMKMMIIIIVIKVKKMKLLKNYQRVIINKKKQFLQKDNQINILKQELNDTQHFYEEKMREIKNKKIMKIVENQEKSIKKKKLIITIML